MVEKIQKVWTEVHNLPLVKPYILSFGTLTSFEQIYFLVQTNKGISRAEVVPLFGYNEETTDTIVRYVEEVKEQLINKNLADARKVFQDSMLRNNGFACSGILTAIDLLEFDITKDLHKSIPTASLVQPYSISDADLIIKKASTQPNAKIKIKLSGNISDDKSFLHKINNGSYSTSLRFDVNQAYNYSEAREFFQELLNLPNPMPTEYIEQPLPIGSWSEHEALRKEFPMIEIMLDEDVVLSNDITKAKAIGANFVKLKLYKQGGIRELIERVHDCEKSNLTCILGNGVAGPLTNAIEYFVYQKHSSIISHYLECNGFLKINSK